jgi:pimeloyl-ACP methyl ester carboxylesterase
LAALQLVRPLLALLLAGVAVALPARASAAARLGPCPGTRTVGLQCTEVEVPLDRTGVVPGTIPLHVEELPANGIQRGTMFLIAGGPGQGSARTYDLGSPDSADQFRKLFPGYALVAVDDRGTGGSGVLSCPALQTAVFASNAQQAVLAGQCGAALGAAAPFYSTQQHAEDLEAVRQALGLGKIGLYGVSYGTKLALAYALAHPDAVERIILDSVVPPALPDPYEANVLRNMPATLLHYCPGTTCRGATPNFASEFVALANEIEAHPVSGLVLQGDGRSVRRRLNGEDLISTVIDLDLNPGLAAEFPAAVHEAWQGDPKQLLRLFDLDRRGQLGPPEQLSYGLYAATTCADGLFPWDPSTPVEQRPALLQAAIGALPAGTLGPFGSWAATGGSAAFCLDWPAPVGRTPLGPGPYPNVPMLAVSGGLDLRTPVESAAQVAAQFPQGHLLVAPGTGHSVLGTDLSGCTQRAVAVWIQTTVLPASCPRARSLLSVVPAVPKSLASLPGKTEGAKATAAVVRTLQEAEGAWLTVLGFGSGGTVGGVNGGRLSARSTGFDLTGYATVPGVKLSGRITARFGLPLAFSGTITVSGAATGKLVVSDSELRGTLDGRRVGA